MQGGDSSQGLPAGVNASQGAALLSPWDAFAYFQPPHEFEVNVNFNQPSVQVIGGDPSRVALIFYVVTGTANAFVTTISGATFGHGLIVGQTTPLFLVQSVYGSLVQNAWFASCSASASTLGIIEVRLKDWPK